MTFKRRDRDDNVYAMLQKHSLEMFQRLSGNRWTDYNEHDPGITLMDALNYALLEIDYLGSFDFARYLADPLTGELEYAKTGLLPADEIFEPCVVTPGDYELLIKENIVGVVACDVKLSNGNSYNFIVGTEPGTDNTKVAMQVKRLYHKHRNLCENLGQVEVAYSSKSVKPRVFTAIEYEQETTKIKISGVMRSQYRSVMNELPDCYGVNMNGLSSHASSLRSAQALQLKAYMLIFDYLLYGAKHQFNNLSRMLSLSALMPDNSMPMLNVENIEKLVNPDEIKQITILQNNELNAIKSTYFDFLDALYGEDTAFVRNIFKGEDEVIMCRARLIKMLPRLNTRRFRSFDLLDETMESMPGIKDLIHALWNHENKREVPLVNVFGRYSLRLVSDYILNKDLSIFFDTRYLVDELEKLGERDNIYAVPYIEGDYPRKKYDLLRRRLNFFTHNLMFESFLNDGVRRDNYRIERLVNEKGYLLLYKHPWWQRWLNLGFFEDQDVLIQTANLLWSFLKMLNSECSTFYLIEDILLKGGDSQHKNNLLNLVFPAWKRRFYESGIILTLFEERLPVHVRTQFHWLDAESMYEFEQHYYPWRQAWASGDDADIVAHSQQIERLLQTNEIVYESDRTH